MAGTRTASHDVHDTAAPQQVKACCHRLARFCDCPPDAPATCPICDRPEADGPHFPAVDCTQVVA